MTFLLLYILIINIAGVIVMKADKSASRIEGKRRVPEKTLFLIAFLGGAAGIYAGMKRFRHKTLHKSFKYGIPAILILHFLLLFAAGILYWLNLIGLM